MTPKEGGYYIAHLSNVDTIYMRFLVAERECRFTMINTLKNTEENALDYLCNQAMRTYGGNYKCNYSSISSFVVLGYDQFRHEDKVLITGTVHDNANSINISFPDEKGYTYGAWVAGFVEHDFDRVSPVK